MVKRIDADCVTGEAIYDPAYAGRYQGDCWHER